VRHYLRLDGAFRIKFLLIIGAFKDDHNISGKLLFCNLQVQQSIAFLLQICNEVVTGSLTALLYSLLQIALRYLACIAMLYNERNLAWRGLKKELEKVSFWRLRIG